MTEPRAMIIPLCLGLAPMLASAQEARAAAAWSAWGTEALEDAERTGERLEPGEPPCLPEDPNRVHATRHLTLYEAAADKVLEVYVAGGVATIIRLPSKLAARGTAIRGGGEQRFDLLMGGKQLLITPTRQLAKGERFPMLVALADGTVLPLSLTRAPEGRRTDGELWLDHEQANPEELRIRLASMKAKAIGFEAGLRQAVREQQSEDFDLAGLMALNQSTLTVFEKARARKLVAGAGWSVKLITYAPRPDVANATSKVVAVFTVTNKGPEPLDLSSASAVRNPDGNVVPFAIRAQPMVIPSGEEGRVAAVLDRASFGSGGTITLALSAKHGDAGIQFSADLSVEDFAAPRAWGPWWPF